jgi:peptide/nickel transport system ATP-binding protein
MLEIENLVVTYGSGPRATTAVDDVSLTVAPNAVVGLVGESGSGKSTLGKAVVGLAPISSGAIRFNGQQVGQRGRLNAGRLRTVQYVFQDPYASLDPRMRVGSSIAEGLGRIGRRAAAAEVDRLLDLVHLDAGAAQQRPRQLSGGQRQRVAIARALAARPELLIADEITSALDVSVQGAILNLLKQIQAETGVGILFISHNLAVVRYMAQEVAVMRFGRLVESGPTDRVIGFPEDTYTRELLAAVPSVRRT